MELRRHHAGFTLLESLVALSIVAILVMVGVPSFQDATLGSQLRSTANDLMASVYLARAEAIKRNTTITLCVSADGVACGAGDWSAGWIVRAGAVVLQRQPPAVTGMQVKASAPALTFRSTGAGATPAAFTVCRSQPRAGRQERVITVDATGRPWVRTTETEVC